ncbi:MAG: peptidoglycan editing factor PgeF [Salinivirgaceae bacterium]|nr:peptidoglycan editing factor PgeF [Salinivirgaceae bacterium]
MIWHTFDKAFEANIKAFTTTKQDLPIHLQRAFHDAETPDVKARLWNNIYQIIAAELVLDAGNLVFAKQTHSNHVAVIDGTEQHLPVPDTDGLITQLSGKCLCIQTADCTPILLVDPMRKVVAALHAGWRGTAQNIAGNAVNLMKKHYQTKPENIQALIGPCISQQVYGVGLDVYRAFEAIGLVNDGLFIPGKKEGKFYLNLNLANTQLLLKEGVLLEKIRTQDWCTFQNGWQFYSARRDGGKTGRIITGIVINE